MKYRIITLLAVLLLATALIGNLHIITRRDRQQNGFSRNLINIVSATPQVLDLHYNSFYFAGFDTTQIFLGNQTSPLLVVTIDTSLTSRHDRQLKPPNSLQLEAIRLTIRSGQYFLTEFAAGKIYTSPPGSTNLEKALAPCQSFIDVRPLTTHNAAVKVHNTDDSGLIMSLLRSDSLLPHPSFPERQIDGIFCIDGIMIFNDQLQALIYIYYYRNQFTVADTSLQVSLRGHTIDTTTRAKITTREI